MKKKSILFILLLMGGIFPILPLSTVADAPVNLSVGQTLSISVNEEGGNKYIYLDINDVGEYEITVTLPDTVRSADYQVINDIDISIMNHYYGLGIPLAFGSIYNDLEDDTDGEESEKFPVYEIPAPNTVGLVLWYETHNYEDLTSTSGSIKVILEHKAISTSTSITLDLNNETSIGNSYHYFRGDGILQLPSTTQSGLYNLSISHDVADPIEMPYSYEVRATGSLISFPSFSAGYVSTDYEPWQGVQLLDDNELMMDVNAYLEFYYDETSSYTPPSSITVTFKLVLMSVNNLASRTFTLGDMDTYDEEIIYFALPSLDTPQHLNVELVGDGWVDMRLVTFAGTDYIGDINYDHPQMEAILFNVSTTVTADMFIENSVTPIPSQYNGIITQIGSLTRRSYENYYEYYNEYSYSFSQNLGMIPQYIGNTTYIRFSGIGEVVIGLVDAEVTDYLSGSITTGINTDSPFKLYKMNVPPEAEKLSFEVTGEGIGSPVPEPTETDDYSVTEYWNVGISMLTPEGPMNINGKNEKEAPVHEIPVFETGDYYFAVTGYHNIDVFNFKNTTNYNMDSLGLKISATIISSETTELVDDEHTIFDLGFGAWMPTTEVRTFNVEQGRVYKIVADMGPFVSFENPTFAFFTFMDTDGNWPFQEIMPMGVGLGLTMFNSYYTALEDEKIYVIAGGIGYVDFRIVEIGKASVKDPDITDEESGFLPISLFPMLIAVIPIILIKKSKKNK